jgi:membrane fusion protein, heavy metal efflux system
MTLRRLVSIAVPLLVAIALAGWRFGPALVAGRTEPQPPPTAPSASDGTTLRFPAGAPQLAFLEVVPVEAAPEPLVDALPGRLAYDENTTARVSAPIGGRVARIRADLGDRVVAGAALATIDAPDFSQALADLERDQLDVKQKRHVHERAMLLHEGGVVARKDMEAAETDLREAEVELARARRRLEALGQNGTERDGQFVLRAPIAGVVTERSINPGTLVGPDSAKPLFVIADLARLRVIVDMPEQSIAALRKGQTASVAVDAYPGRAFTARIDHVGEVLDPVSRRVQVRGDLDNAEHLLEPEMFARVTPVASDGTRRPRVPNGALVTVGVKAYVFRERAPGVFERRPVTVATQGREFTYVKDGIAAGDRVVVSGALMLESELQSR